MKKAFTLIEMLVVIGIIVILIGSSVAGYAHVRKSAENARAREMVVQVKTALESIYDADGIWPKTIREKSGVTDSVIDQHVAYVLAKKGTYTATYSDSSLASTGVDRFGILSPWGADTVKRRGLSASLSSHVDSGGTVQDHLLRFKVDYDGDGIVEGVTVGGESVNVRAHAVVWCAGKDGKMLPYRKGVRSGGIYSWTPGQTVDAR